MGILTQLSIITIVNLYLVSSEDFDFGADKAFWDLFLKYGLQCVNEVRITNPDFCLQTIVKDSVPEDKTQYNKCLTGLACGAKKFGSMDKDGKWIWSAVQKHIDGLQTPIYKQAGQFIFDNCQTDIEGNQGVITVFRCAYKKNKTVKNALDAMFGIFSKG